MTRGCPAALVVYDEALGEYVPHYGAVCAARWATGNRDHGAGDLCGAPAVEEIGDSELCAHHYKRAMEWFYKHRIETPERVQREVEAARLRAAHQARLAAEARSIVYVIRRSSDGLIKIGTTTRYGQRMTTLRGEHGELALLLAMPGGRKEEAKIHGSFVGLRVEGEWFRPASTLLRWILRKRREHNFPETRLPKAVPQKEIVVLLEAAMRERRAAADPAA